MKRLFPIFVALSLLFLGCTEKEQQTRFTVNGVTFDMVTIQGKAYSMGDLVELDDDVLGDASPSHAVHIKNFQIGKNEVTQGLWKAVMGENPSHFKGDNLPVECVSWDDCQTFIKKLNRLTGKRFRMPTEAEWEFVARGANVPIATPYSGGFKGPTVAWCLANSDGTTHPVCSLLANEVGVYDMSGNVLEWCSDWYGKYSEDHKKNPTGPKEGTYRVTRGGSWNQIDKYCRVSIRNYCNPDCRSSEVGLRLAR